MKKAVSVPGRDIPVLADADVVVAGGGPSGFAAAVTASRAGLQVILIKRYGFLGGIATAGAAGTLCGLYLRHSERIEPIIVGRYVLTQADVLAGRIFDDVVCLCSWPLELWEGGTEHRMVFLPEGRYYGIPYRSLLSREINNLLVTGRAISMDHGAFASARVMGPCFAEGQAAGKACTLALTSGRSLNEITIDKLHEVLAKYGARLS